MILPDVNILVRAFRKDAPGHLESRQWLEEMIGSEAVFGVSDLVLSGFLRIVTHPRVFDPPTPLESSLEFVEALRVQPNVVVLSPGRRHWRTFTRLCREVDARGNLVPDAFLAALAIESGSEWITTDRDFARFPRLRSLMVSDAISIRQPECNTDPEQPVGYAIDQPESTSDV